ncbi:PTS sugar transporter subunit IIB [Frigoribacterium sp. CFBP9039]|uniref:PTS sugar transporter subunit IIB n=1 Tax=Frigoribacterium TaxID=96492 RepID=UPI00177BBA19|nr:MULTISPECIES: PTS sugar transporter subunit IIB [Frigoribacterium]MBD8704027.1 PTS sugar transporter subunit IIB [Frigoribacterium sp. CFBP 13712]MCJ0701936.1 PTS sugar transporter subunit IIB [Frigoribacterium faeni]MDY0891473.1 PTS sugar transporter subunit IIB [Frigoribacterium sp. CFBP9030]MDY0947087.1 PTS sugar transporter subunit IIB [Frigoribacterium sp. CFBP9039]
MKIITVCGMGIGTSVLLKMNAEKALRALDVDADVEAADIGTARGAARTAQIVLTSADLVEELGEVPSKVIVIDNFTSVAEIQAKLQESIA